MQSSIRDRITESEEDLSFRKSLAHQRKGGLKEIVHEFFTNALDANQKVASSRSPTLSLSPDKKEITVTDDGVGLTPGAFVFGPKSIETSTHGCHGLGLKDAIATCLRLEYLVTISSQGKIFSFHEGNDVVRMRTCIQPEPHRGTVVKMRCNEGFKKSDFDEARDQFLCLQERRVPIDDQNGIAFYPKMHRPKATIYVRGVAKNGLDKFRQKGLQFDVNFYGDGVCDVVKAFVSRDQNWAQNAHIKVPELITSAKNDAVGT